MKLARSVGAEIYKYGLEAARLDGYAGEQMKYPEFFIRAACEAEQSSGTRDGSKVVDVYGAEPDRERESHGVLGTDYLLLGKYDGKWIDQQRPPGRATEAQADNDCWWLDAGAGGWMTLAVGRWLPASSSTQRHPAASYDVQPPADLIGWWWVPSPLSRYGRSHHSKNTHVDSTNRSAPANPPARA